MKHFDESEFACKCCGYNNASPLLMAQLDYARADADVPFIINSGCRCDAHNAAVGGSPTSSHLGGWAVDIQATNSADRLDILTSLIKVGFTRIGIAGSFIHVDVDPDKPDACWVYG